MLSRMRFLLLIPIIFTVSFLMHLYVYASAARVFDFSWPYEYWVIAAVASLYLFASASARRWQGVISDSFYFAAATWVGVLWLFFSATVVYGAITPFLSTDSVMLYASLLGLALLLSIGALINARRLVVREYTIPLQGLSSPMRVAHLTDIHVGTINQKKFIERVVRLTNETKPDVVLITGDLFDGSVLIDESMLQPLNDLVAPVYFSTGNHEGYEGLDHVRETMSRLDVTLLENAVADFRGVRIVGVHDRQSLPRGTTLDSILGSLSIDGTKPTILMYHTPVEWLSARTRGVGLMLSGHTHNGQIFPFTLLVKLFFRQIKGLYKKDGKYLHVSPGTGTWGPPMRLGSTNQVTLLTLVPSE
ncbi:metallophosphoesterase [Patescibacteria group bacterium]|nr:metallophosphoesterase [Patescibacteria group bacterium]